MVLVHLFNFTNKSGILLIMVVGSIGFAELSFPHESLIEAAERLHYEISSITRDRDRALIFNYIFQFNNT